MLSWNAALLSILSESSLRALLAAIAIAGILAALRARSSSLKHAAWTAVLGVMLAMPVLPSLLPSITIRLPESSRRLPVVPEPAVLAPLPQNLDDAGDDLRKPAAALPGAPARKTVWPSVAASVYIGGVSLLLVRLGMGWLAMRRIVRSTKVVRGTIHESEAVATPMTIGILSPIIILPASWRSWSRSKRRAILAHELSHVRRMDPLVAFLAHLNCCLFWFHPVAWWLERKLACTAEHACDDAAVRATGHAGLYAKVLLEIAESVRRNRGRLRWQAIGVDGNGLLEERIDRILRARPFPVFSLAKKVLLVLSCTAAIAAVVACRKESRPSLLEEEQALVRVTAAKNYQKAAIETNNSLWQDFQNRVQAAAAMTPEDVMRLEGGLAKNPDDLDQRLKLVLFYAWQKSRGSTATPLPGGKEHVLWIIAHHPGHAIARSSILRGILAGDPAGYAEAKNLWVLQSGKGAVTPSVLGNAAYFFETGDRPLAEQMLRKAQSLEPNPRWRFQLARLYILALLGVTDVWEPMVVFLEHQTVNLVIRRVSNEEAHGLFAQDVRRTLEASNDDLLLTEVGEFLVTRPSSQVFKTAAAEFEDYPNLSELGRKYLRRALAINPHSEAGIYLAGAKIGDRQARLRELPKDGRYQAVSALPENERFELLWELAKSSYSYGSSFDSTQRDDARKEWEKARRYAEDLVKLAPKFRGHPEYSTAIVNGNTMLGFVAVVDGDLAAAGKFLREATKAPVTSDPLYRPTGPWSRLCSALLSAGEREAVIDYLERTAQIDLAQRDEILAALAELRSGRMPDWYRQGRL